MRTFYPRETKIINELYCEMLTGLHGEGSDHYDYDDPESTKEWARGMGWTGRMSKPENML